MSFKPKRNWKNQANHERETIKLDKIELNSKQELKLESCKVQVVDLI